MAITHAAAVRTAIADLVVDRIDAGSTAGKLIIYDGATPLTEHTLNDPAFGGASGPTATANAIGDGTVAAGGGTPDNFEVLDSDDNVVFSGSVGLDSSGADLEFDSVTWAEGGTVSIGSGTYTAPA